MTAAQTSPINLTSFSLSRDPAMPSHWRCATCGSVTYVSPCGVCFSPRVAASSSLSAPAPASWTCASCSLRNVADAASCAACDLPQPTPSASSRRAGQKRGRSADSEIGAGGVAAPRATTGRTARSTLRDEEASNRSGSADDDDDDDASNDDGDASDDDDAYSDDDASDDYASGASDDDEVSSGRRRSDSSRALARSAGQKRGHGRVLRKLSTGGRVGVAQSATTSASESRSPSVPFAAPPLSSPRRGTRAIPLTEVELSEARARRLSDLLQRTTSITAALSEKLRALAAARAALEKPAPCAHGGLLSLSPGRGLPADALGDSAAATAAVEQPTLVSGATLRDYQLAGVRWLVSLHDAQLNGILADEMGLGKTLQVLAFFAYLSEARREKGPFLVVVPLSVLSNWKADAERFAPLLAQRMHIHHGDAGERAFSLADFFARTRADARSPDVDARLGGTAVVLTTFELAMRDAPLLRRHAWSYIVVDEGHRLKRGDSRLGDALRSLRAPRRLLLTGTPLQNSLDELWALLNFTLPAIFDSAVNFNEWFAAPFGAHTDDAALALSPDEQRLVVERLHAVLRPFLLRRVKADLQLDLHLPPCRKVELPCAMSALQVALYERARAGLRDFVDPASGRVKSLSLANLFMRLRQVCNHPSLLADEWLADASLVRASGKFETLHRLLPKLVAAGHSVLIFSQMTSALDLLEDLCGMVGLTWLRIDGNTRSEDRVAAISRFADARSKDRVFLLSTRAGGLGVNLQSADTVILFDSDWNPQADLQAQARAHRIGQARDVLVIRLVSMGPPARGDGGSSGYVATYAASVEELMLKRASGKLRTEAAVIGAGHFNHDVSHELFDGDDGDEANSGEWVSTTAGGKKRGSGLVAAVLAGRLRGDDGDHALLPPSSTPLPFAALADSVMNAICARGENEAALFAQFDADRERADAGALKAMTAVVAAARRDGDADAEAAAVDAALADMYCTPAAERSPGSGSASGPANSGRGGRHVATAAAGGIAEKGGAAAYFPSLLAIGKTSPRRPRAPPPSDAQTVPIIDDSRLRSRLVQPAELQECYRSSFGGDPGASATRAPWSSPEWGGATSQ